MENELEYIRNRYQVPAEINREVIVNGKKGVITKDMGSYIGVDFYAEKPTAPQPCHPTWEVQYLETFNHKPPVFKMTRSKQRYQDYLHSEYGGSFKEYLGIRDKKRF
jgi:hypothetical protein